jgi:oxalate decarboxylase/phosphoglucose isomerase-like protein (cupin superfamily)
MHFSTIISVGLSLASGTLAVPTKETKPFHKVRTSGNGSENLPPTGPVDTHAGDQSFIQKLELAASQQDRFALLQPSDLVFDFKNPPSSAIVKGNGGMTVAATVDDFPYLVGNDVSMTVGFINACGLNSPHVHPRSPEINIIVQGRVVTNFVAENGVKAQQSLLNTYQMSVFPQGAMHAEYNPDCEPAVFVAGFNSNDPGVQQTAQSFFELREDLVESTLGVEMINGEDIETFAHLLPANVVGGVKECLAKCGKKTNPKRALKSDSA